MLTADLIGPELDYWVAMALDHTVVMFAGAPKVMDWQKAGSIVRGNPFIPSTHWAQGGPIIEHKHISIEEEHPGCWFAQERYTKASARADTPLVAAMRAFVASKFGPEVQP